MPTDGMKLDSRNIARVEPLLSVGDLKLRYLHGLESVDNEGNAISDTTLQAYIDIAISQLEMILDISIVQREETEEKDYHGNDWLDWGYFQLNNLPVLQVKSLTLTYLRDAAGAPESALLIPLPWIRLREHDGLVRLVPNNAIPASLMVDSGGAFFPEFFRRYSNIPQLFTIVYNAGFPDGKVPKAINAAIGLIAAIYALNNAADLILGAGIASQSLSIDGLSQSISSTSSAENHNNSAKVKEYNAILFGPSVNSPDRGLVRILRDYWQSESIQIL